MKKLADDQDLILQNLRERVKELTALHRTARILQDHNRPVANTVRMVVDLLPNAWQYPEITTARIRFGNLEVSSSGFAVTEWRQKSTFVTREGDSGDIEIVYSELRPFSFEGPFLAEERELIDSLAEMLRAYFQRRVDDESLQQAHNHLEQQVIARTAELKKMNEALQHQLADYQVARQRIDLYQKQLRQLASELSLAEARERRVIASDLHDHIGQALAFMKMKLTRFRSDTIFCGFERSIDEILSLLNQTIQYTRTLTFEISPPVLYELGLPSAVEWLGEQFQKKFDIETEVIVHAEQAALKEEIQVALFKSLQELLNNAAKHSHATRIRVELKADDKVTQIRVTDNGRGFDLARLEPGNGNKAGFGLFSIRERLNYLGGQLEVRSSDESGAQFTMTVPHTAEGSK